jgi:dihydroorotase
MRLRELDGRGKVIVPGLIDLHVHFREPGDTGAETVASGSRAAAAGGFTTVVTMPNTRPPVDTPERVAWQTAEAERVGLVRVLPSGCLTRERRGGQVADLDGMARAGAAAFTDDGTTVADEAVMEAALRSAAALGKPALDHALDPALAGAGVMRAGDRSRGLGLAGVPPEAEIRMVERDITLAERTGAAVHVQHLSCGESAARVRAARKRNPRVTAEVTPHHLALCDDDVRAEAPEAFKMSPPLGSRDDRERLIEAVADGTVTVLATDHAPHRAVEKAKGFAAAPFGVVGLETAVGVTYTLLVLAGRMGMMDWVRRWTVGPASVLGIPSPSLADGAPADVTVLDLDSEWTVRSDSFASKSVNTPFSGRRLHGRAVWTFLGGRLVHRLDGAVDLLVGNARETR